MFRNGRFTLAALTSLASFVSLSHHCLSSCWLQRVLQPVVSALLATPWPIGIVLIAPHAGRWADTISAPHLDPGLVGLSCWPRCRTILPLEYLPAQPGLRDWVWLLPEPHNREMLSNVAREYASYASGVSSIVIRPVSRRRRGGRSAGDGRIRP
jgi:DHA2 family multidrug resistance protein-like MFS transporter